jgi:hypothetical protein
MEQTLFTPSSADPANDPFLDRPEADLAWKLPMLRELAELGMDMARDVRDRAVAEPKPEPATADDEADEPTKDGGKADSLARASRARSA